MWTPAIVGKGGKYYVFFPASDVHSDHEVDGINVADHSAVPFHDLPGKPLIGAFHNGAADRPVRVQGDSCKNRFSAAGEPCSPSGNDPVQYRQGADSDRSRRA